MGIVAADAGTRLVAGASEASFASLSRPRNKSADHESLDRRPDSDLGVNPPPVLTEAHGSVPASCLALDDTITAPPPSAPQEDFKAHQDLLKQMPCSCQLQVEEMEGPSDSLLNVLSS
ncbi:hypothetical protein UY3_18605 [Chelonia mydas]|uniref:Uncharacterized protein n=1 Tax=Chelonia mydas TaxID=8469 RepID=M7B7Z4_CHEMY|nr:hypothetical protein UY3_18605 [Chelonia mydas]